jgi:hypothetical protein
VLLSQNVEAISLLLHFQLLVVGILPAQFHAVGVDIENDGPLVEPTRRLGLGNAVTLKLAKAQAAVRVWETRFP